MNTPYTTKSGKTVTLRDHGYMVHGQEITPEENEEIWEAWMVQASQTPFRVFGVNRPLP